MNKLAPEYKISKTRPELLIVDSRSNKVLLPGYTTDNQIGYFVCEEICVLDDDFNTDHFEYNELSFHQNYIDAVKMYKQLVA